MSEFCQVLLIHSNQQTASVFQTEFSAGLKADLILTQHASQLISLLDILPETVLLIALDLNHQELLELNSLLQKRQITIPLAYIGNQDPHLLFARFIDRKHSMNLQLQQLSLLGKIPLREKGEGSEPFAAVPVQYFLNLQNVFCDVYVRIKKAGQKSQFIKRILAHDAIEKEVLEKYIENGLEYFYIPSQFKENFMVHFANQTMMQLQDPALSQENKLSFNSGLYEILQENIINEFDSVVVELAQESIKEIKSSLEENPGLFEFYQNLLSSSTHYHYSLTHLTILVVHQLLNAFPWATSEHRNKLTYAAFFNDLMLNDEKILRIRSQNEMDSSTLTIKEKNEIQGHVLEIIHKLEQLNGLPAGVEVIIREHHGDKHGLVFKQQWDPDLTPLSRIFIIAEEFAFQFLEYQNSSPDIQNILKKMCLRYPHDNARKLIRILESTIASKI